ncbi:Uncharacterized protein HZ326_0561 [Fusarium oxysporum f. sp. albedinis]|nr:Uncharacterized protein HZ326_0561 [Fusarium oxysporum f. sp. albedinis]
MLVASAFAARFSKFDASVVRARIGFSLLLCSQHGYKTELGSPKGPLFTIWRVKHQRPLSFCPRHFQVWGWS